MLLFAWALLALLATPADATLPRFTFSTDAPASLDEHRRFGHELGATFASMIRERFSAKAQLQTMLRHARNTTSGAKLYGDFLAVHEWAYPHAVAELRGIAEGSKQPFDAVFVQNILEEYSLCASETAPSVVAGHTPVVDHCSDVMSCGEEGEHVCAVAHNEDADLEDLGRVVLVSARFGKVEWFAAAYAGALPTGAFGHSHSGGFGFTLNYVGPKEVVCPGVGRGFVSRSLLDAESFDEAISTATTVKMSAGHNYQFWRSNIPAIHNVEVAARGLYAVRPISEEAFFHANQYETLNVPQMVGNSSLHRVARAKELLEESAPTTTDALLRIIGDQGDRQWPIFHDAASHARGDLSLWTVCSVLVDLRAQKLTVYSGNPKQASTRVVVLEVPLGSQRTEESS